jgi:hypothetical protein
MCNEIFAELREMVCSILFFIVLIHHLSFLFPDSEFNYCTLNFSLYVENVKCMEVQIQDRITHSLEH